MLLIYLLLNALYTTILLCLSSKHARSEKSGSSLINFRSRSLNFWVLTLALFNAHAIYSRSQDNNKSTLVENENDKHKTKENTHTHMKLNWFRNGRLSATIETRTKHHYRYKRRAKTWMSVNVVYRFLVEFCYFMLKYVRALRTDCERSVWNCLTCAACQRNT